MADRIAIHDVMHRYALAIDTKDWELLSTVFADVMVADFRSFGAPEIFRGSAADWVSSVQSTISGMDATQHLMANHLYDVIDDLAVGTTYIRAAHICRNEWGGDTYTIGGHYEVKMRRTHEGWRIVEYTLVVTHHEGDRHVLRSANRKAKANAQ
ncbi:MAG: nuclear transport factor 2 family protein [Gammaproteobacteria bacterium]|nr:nuclear transport factor 2 family protein [Gammaproteobacteria bacterium]